MITEERFSEIELDIKNFQFMIEIINGIGPSFITAMPPGPAWVEDGHNIFVIADMDNIDLIRCIPKCKELFDKIKNPTVKMRKLHENVWTQSM